MFSWYKYLIVGLVFSHLGFWSGNIFLSAPFPDRCLLVPFLMHLEQHFYVTENDFARKNENLTSSQSVRACLSSHIDIIVCGISRSSLK